MHKTILGRKRSAFKETILPSNKDVLARIRYLIENEKKSKNESIHVVAEEIIHIYSKFHIPTRRIDSIIRKIATYYDEYYTLRRHRNEGEQDWHKAKVNEFTPSLDTLFDVAHDDFEIQMKNYPLDKEFYLKHRRSMKEVRIMVSVASQLEFEMGVEQTDRAVASTSRANIQPTPGTSKYKKYAFIFIQPFGQNLRPFRHNTEIFILVNFWQESAPYILINNDILCLFICR